MNILENENQADDKPMSRNNNLLYFHHPTVQPTRGDPKEAKTKKNLLYFHGYGNQGGSTDGEEYEAYNKKI